MTIREGGKESKEIAEDPSTDCLESAKLEKLIEGICLLLFTLVRHFHHVSEISLASPQLEWLSPMRGNVHA